MKKYYLKGENEPLLFGDKIGFNITKEEDGKSIERHIETVFTPDSIDILKDLDVIEEREETIDFSDDDKKYSADDVLENLINTVTILTDKLTQLYAKVNILEDKVKSAKATEKKDCYNKDCCNKKKSPLNPQPGKAQRTVIINNDFKLSDEDIDVINSVLKELGLPDD